ncbi:hypothetical protein K439DRAFT_1623307 [Ramaria rubella]|nr:hypothetical protein K439DRAFT_1623307 [Ramaria rubella]
MQELNRVGEEEGPINARMLEIFIERELTLFERNLVGWEPRCISWHCESADTDQDIRLLSAHPQRPEIDATARFLKPCLDCRLTLYCSEEHWEKAKRMHREAPCGDGHDGHSQYALNLEQRTDIHFANIMAERVKPVWTSLKGATWAGEFESKLRCEFQLKPSIPTASFLRAASESLSFPMTILWALENLNSDVEWTRRETLTIHIFGAYDKGFFIAFQK